MLEIHDQQYTAAMQARDGKAKGASHTEKSHKLVEQPRTAPQTQNSEKPTGESIGPSVPKQSGVQQKVKFSCWRCGETGHLARNCKKNLVRPQRVPVKVHPVDNTLEQLLLRSRTLYRA